jgi:hypothetical protein
VKRRSPLDSLEQLRTRARDEQRAELKAQIEAAEAARERRGSAERAWQASAEAHKGARTLENQRLSGPGISAAEGQRCAAWEASCRQQLAALESDLERRVSEQNSALAKQSDAAARLTRLDAELKQVSERLLEQARERARQRENGVQEVADELALQRFRGRKGA